MEIGKLKIISQYLIAIFIIFEIISASPVSAASSNNILVNIIPENPNPFEDTSISLNSYADNLDTVLITWSVDGKNAASGIGKKSFSVKAPAAGSSSAVVAKISLPAGTVETRITIRPSVMVLLWQANDSYVPPFYRGKAMPTAESEVKVVAMPEIRTGAGKIDPKNMTYAWKKDFSNSVEGSGYGKNFFVYTNDYLDGSNDISVVASTVDQTNSSQASLTVGTVQPKIIFYRRDDSLGTLWERALVNPHTIQGTEILEAAPYFISPKAIQNPALVWSWFINDSLVNNLSIKKNVMPVKVPEETSGTSKIRLDIENRGKIFQTASKEININF